MISTLIQTQALVVLMIIVGEDDSYSADGNSIAPNKGGTMSVANDDDPVDNATIVSDNGSNTCPSVDQVEEPMGPSDITMLSNAHVNCDLEPDNTSAESCAADYSTTVQEYDGVFDGNKIVAVVCVMIADDKSCALSLSFQVMIHQYFQLFKIYRRH